MNCKTCQSALNELERMACYSQCLACLNKAMRIACFGKPKHRLSERFRLALRRGLTPERESGITASCD